MKLNKRNNIFILFILLFILLLSGCSNTKDIVKNSPSASKITNTIKESETKTAVKDVNINKFTNETFKKDVSNIYSQCSKGWENKVYTVSYTKGDYIAFSKKYSKLLNLSDYEQQVYTDVTELNVTICNYLKWIPDKLNAEETPDMKTRIEFLLNKYKSVL